MNWKKNQLREDRRLAKKKKTTQRRKKEETQRGRLRLITWKWVNRPHGKELQKQPSRHSGNPCEITTIHCTMEEILGPDRERGTHFQEKESPLRKKKSCRRTRGVRTRKSTVIRGSKFAAQRGAEGAGISRTTEKRVSEQESPKHCEIG